MVSLSPLGYVSSVLLTPLSLVYLLIFLPVLFWVVFYQKKRLLYKNIPPGPTPWPVVGNVGGFFIPTSVRKILGQQYQQPGITGTASLSHFAELYGNIYSFFMGSQLIVVLNGYEMVRDALSNHAEVFSDRPDAPVITILTKRKGIVFAPYGPVWRKQRKFCHASLRNFGLGKLSLEPSILQSLETLKTEILRKNEESGSGGMNLSSPISSAVSNVICSMILGQQFQFGDPEFRILLDLVPLALEVSMNSAAILINVFPPLFYLPFGPFKDLRHAERDIGVFLKKMIADHRETLDPNNPRDLVDMYLMEVMAQKAAGEHDSTFTEDYLFYIIADLFVAGSDTTTNSVLWFLLFMILHPDIQDKIQAEIDEVVGRDRVPSLTDRGSMPFTEATILETQRLAVVVPLSIPHMASETTEFRGYTIPKGTVIFPNLWSVLRDPTVWEDPETFNPARFLDNEGNLLRKEFFIPFGIGRRVCMGEQLAKMEMFLMVTHLLQAFKFRIPEGQPPPSLEERFGLTVAPKPYNVCVTARNDNGGTDSK
ncbi:cytochrome P450 2U1 [Cololabis saira]|uniref:cytochrome P450 2U1 n=1 Tax=Cololabis saira TaxID=129043 RepID=UPI002AD33648|nr:cytochrome P450 2U1 [Cololabis saira]